MGAMAALAVGAMATGGILGATGSIIEGQAQEEALSYNISATREAQRQKESQLAVEGERLRSANIVAAAKSGVRREGSPAEVLAANAAEIARQQKLSRLVAEANVDLMQYEKKMGRISTGLSVSGQLLGTAGQSAGLALLGG